MLLFELCYVVILLSCVCKVILIGGVWVVWCFCFGVWF